MYIQILQLFKTFQSKTRSLGCRRFFALKMVILQDCASQMVILQDLCKTNGYLARRMVILQDLARKSCKTMHRLARFARILQDLAR